MMSERAFEWSDIAVVGCIPVSRDGWQNVAKKFGKSLQPLQSNAESLGNIRALDGYEPGCNLSVAVVCSFQFHLSSVQCSSVTSAVLCMPVSGRLDNKCRKKSLGKVCSLCSQMLRAQETSGLSMATNQAATCLWLQFVVSNFIFHLFSVLP